MNYSELTSGLDLPNSGINHYTSHYLAGLGDLGGKVVLDVPAGV